MNPVIIEDQQQQYYLAGFGGVHGITIIVDIALAFLVGTFSNTSSSDGDGAGGGDGGGDLTVQLFVRYEKRISSCVK